MSKQNWFETLNDALDSENLIETWDVGGFAPIQYGQNFSYNAMVDGKLHHISLFRESDGRYERPVHYNCL